jgi:alpha-tubulin suppressor-like RCC1 family protein
MATSQGGYVDGGFDLLKAPDAPTITSVTTSIGSMSVAFTAPANPGGSAVTGYTVTAINESTGASVGATGSASPISISPGGGTFRVRAAATNIYGPGRVSAFNTGNVVFSGAELETWGGNGFGQLGLGDTVARSSPVQVGALQAWSVVSSGGYASAAIKTDNTLWAWGYNGTGGLGDNTIITRSSPVQVGALTVWATVAVEGSATAAVRTNGTLWTWGLNNAGQLGQNFSGFQRSSPIQVGALTDWAKVTAFKQGSAFTSVKTNGTLWAWGSNASSKLGDTTSTYRSSPVQIGALTNWYSTAGGYRHCIAVKTDGTLWAWGYNGNGQLGLNSVSGVASPNQVGSLTTWAIPAAGRDHSAATTTNFTLWAWGRNNHGQLGQNNLTDRSSPVQVGALTNWQKVDAASFHTACAKTDGTLWEFGRNNNGQLGDNTIVNRSSPVQVGALTGWFDVSAGGTFGSGFTLALYGVT